MILQKLIQFYDRKAEAGEIAAPGYCVQQMNFELVLRPDGSCVGVHDLRDATDKKPRACSMIVPGSAKPPGSGLNPSLHGWDRTDYMLGYLDHTDTPAADLEKRQARCAKAHAAFKEGMLAREHEINAPVYSAFCRFLTNHDPAAIESDFLREVSGTFGVVRLAGEKTFLHDLPPLASNAEVAAPDGRCLVNGELSEIAPTHEPKIKGVNGAQSAGAAIVSFNFGAAESYGKKQSHNGPVSKLAAFKYATALNSLLDRNGKHRLQMANDTCVFWAERPSVSEDLFCFALTDHADDDARQELAETLKQLVRGVGRALDADAGFYVLCLAPNAARLSVRYWNASNVADLLGAVVDHQRELEIIRGPKDTGQIPLWRILKQTARESKEISPSLAGPLLRSVLQRQPYPQALFAAIQRRIRADREINMVRAAVLKAILNRNYHKEVPVSLDPTRPEPAYQLGRLFAALEKAQENALGRINASIKDRYFSAASATPGAVFPRLIRMSQHYIGKLQGGQKVVSEKRIQEIMGRIADFPSNLDLVGQGLFALGYYHQRQDLFTKKTEHPEEDSP